MPRLSSSIHRQYSFGPYTLDPARRLLWRDGTLVQLTPKTIDVLAVLVEHHGQVVAKSELLDFVWPNAIVEENNLARQISMLRKALQQRRGQHDIISTIPGRGYMFVADVSTGVNQPAPEPPVAPVDEIPASRATVERPPQRRARWDVVAAAALVLVAIASSVLLAPLGRKGPSLPAGDLRQLTFDAGLQRDPAWSPDGASLVFASDQSGNLDLYRRSLADPTPVRLTSSPEDESQPDWSPDGKSLAFRSEKDGGGIYVLRLDGGSATRRVTTFGFLPRWSPDGSRILFRASMLRSINSGVFTVTPGGSDLREVQPDLLGQFRAPHVDWHPDGRRVSIAGRHETAGWSFATAPLNGGAAVFSAVAPAFETLRMQDVTPGGFVWSRSGRELYFEGRSPDVQSIWRVGVDPESLAWKRGPQRIATGPGEYGEIALSADGSRLAFGLRTDRTRVWSFPFAPGIGALTGEGHPVTRGGPAEYDVAASLDGTKVAYRTRRGGRQELWQRSMSGEDEQLLVASASSIRTSPRWSRDGTRLAYLRRTTGPADPSVSRAIAIMPAGGGDEQLLRLPVDIEVVPDDWSADGLRILGACRRATQPMATCIISSTGSGVRDVRVVAADPARSLLCQRFSPDERWISFMAVDSRRLVSTIYVMPESGGRWIPMTAGDSYDDKPRWSPDGRLLYFLSARDGTLNLWGRRFDPVAGRPVGDAFRVTAFHGSGPALPRDLGPIEIAISSNHLFVPITESTGTIWMLEGVNR